MLQSIKHPEVEGFIDAKLESDKVTGANISVKIDDEFMKCIETGEGYKQQFPIGSDNPIVSQTVDAKKIWDKIVHNAWKSAEPGVIFWDTVARESVPDLYEEYGFKAEGTNPCQPKWATVLTPDGIKTIGDINIGDLIWSETGWTKVINKWSTGVKEVYEYRTASGSFVGTKNHRVLENGVKVEVQNATSIDVLETTFDSSGKAKIWNEEIISIIYKGEEEVFDMTVDNDTHTYWTGGLNVSNCGR